MTEQKVNKDKRLVNGILLLDKPPGLTSNQALQKVKRLFAARKAGHGGTLDQPAEGCLPIMFGSYTKLAEYMLDSYKVYECDIELGITTTTGDAEGEIIEEKPVPDFDAETLEDCLSKFRGEIMQHPPAYSALKYKGKRMHEYARAGIAVSRLARKVTIYELLLLNVSDNHLKIRMTCSRGTYVRSVANDLGVCLGCGAHVHTLRRTEMSVLPVKYLVTLAQIEENALETRDSLLIADKHLDLVKTKVYVTDEQAKELNHGKKIAAVDVELDIEAELLMDKDVQEVQDAIDGGKHVAIYIKDSEELSNSPLFGVGGFEDNKLRTHKILRNVL